MALSANRCEKSARNQAHLESGIDHYILREDLIGSTVAEIPPHPLFIIRKTPTGFFMPIWPTMHINSRLAMVKQHSCRRWWEQVPFC
jgi:hypothetical protein